MPAGRRSLHGDGGGPDAGDDDGAHQRQRKTRHARAVAHARIVLHVREIPRIEPSSAGSGCVVGARRAGRSSFSLPPQQREGGREKVVTPVELMGAVLRDKRSWSDMRFK